MSLRSSHQHHLHVKTLMWLDRHTHVLDAFVRPIFVSFTLCFIFIFTFLSEIAKIFMLHLIFEKLVKKTVKKDN